MKPACARQRGACLGPVHNGVEPPPLPGAFGGITLLEVLIVLLVTALVIGTATPAYLYMIEGKKTDLAIQEITDYQRRIDRFSRKNNRYPDSLEEVLGTAPVDPWGNPYQYLNLKNASAAPGSPGPRTGTDLVPLNADYDLYSEGPDTDSLSPIAAGQSRDDIIRGRNGNYVGIAADF